MIVSSRTPEGLPSQCPVCLASVVIEPSQEAGDAPCPHCGVLLWFVTMEGELRFFRSGESHVLREILKDRIREQWSIPPGEDVEQLMRQLEMDSLDVVELVMEIEDEDGVFAP